MESDATLDLLICHLPEREPFLRRLRGILDPQLTPRVRILVDDSRSKSIGEKRNDLLARAAATYVAFIDDDDRVGANYVALLQAGMNEGVDCCSLTGEITVDGAYPRPFIHSTRYRAYFEEAGCYYRYPNHLNCLKTEISRRFRFPATNLGEDLDFATQMFKAGALRTEHEIKETIYFYDYRSTK